MATFPQTPKESFENLLNRTVRKDKVRVEELGWSPEEIESTLGKKENILSFLQETMGKPYIKILKEGTGGAFGDIDRPYYQHVSDAPDTMGVFEHQLLEDYGAEVGHGLQDFESDIGKHRTLLDSLGGDYEKLYEIPGSREWIHSEGGAHSKIDSLININAQQPFNKEIEGKTFLDMITKIFKY